MENLELVVSPATTMPLTLPCESVATHAEFRALSSLANITVDLRYATSRNFVGRDLYSPLDCAWLHRDAADALQRAAQWLSMHAPYSLHTPTRGLRLCVLDALRPQRVQEALWQTLRDTPLRIYLAPPERGSIHSFGMAVDVTLLDADGAELDMGTGFDDMTELSHPALENEFLRTGDLAPEQVANRHLLRNAMHHGGFTGINTEWWHFDCGDRIHVRANYARVL